MQPAHLFKFHPTLGGQEQQGPEHTDTIGVNQYLFYWFNDCLGLGGRAEWWKSDQGGFGSDSYYEITGGVNYKPMANLVIRPEVRYQWSPDNNATPAQSIVPVDEFVYQHHRKD